MQHPITVLPKSVQDYIDAMDIQNAYEHLNIVDAMSVPLNEMLRLSQNPRYPNQQQKWLFHAEVKRQLLERTGYWEQLKLGAQRVTLEARRNDRTH